MDKFTEGDEVKVTSTSARMDGALGTITHVLPGDLLGVIIGEVNYLLTGAEVEAVGMTKDKRRRIVNLLLEYNGTPYRHLYEYPYRADESDELIDEANGILEEILKLLKED